LSLLSELKRRNVIRMAGLYLVGAWLITQVAGTVLPMFEVPAWVSRAVVILLAVGFVPALAFAWIFELTPDGLKRDAEVSPDDSIAPRTARRMNQLLLTLMALALAYFAIDKFVLTPGREAAGLAATAPGATSAGTKSTTTISDKSVAVLPFVAMSQSPEDGYFADGLSEEIINALTTLPDLLVTARTSAFHFKNKDVPIPEVAKALGVAHVVEGSVRRAGDNLRVTAQLIRASDGFHLWSQSYDRPVADIFAVQQDIAANVARALDVVLDASKRERMLASGTRNVEAFLAYRRAVEALDDWHATDRRSGKMWDALDLLNQATALDPEFVMAELDSADPYTHYLMGHIPPPKGGLEPAQALANVRAHYDRAFDAARDPDTRLWIDLERQVFAEHWDRVPGLIAQLRQRIAAGKQFNMIWLSDLMTSTGHAKDYLDMVDAGAQRNPLDREQRGKAALAAEAIGDYARTEQLIRDSIAQVGRTGLITEAEILMELDRGRPDRALAIGLALEAGSTSRSYLPVAQAAMGDVEAARKSLAALEAEGERPVLLILPYFQLGDIEAANRIAAQVDARPLGSLELLGEVSAYGGRLPFDPKVAPNFVRRMKEAGAPTGPMQPFKPGVKVDKL